LWRRGDHRAYDTAVLLMEDTNTLPPDATRPRHCKNDVKIDYMNDDNNKQGTCAAAYSCGEQQTRALSIKQRCFRNKVKRITGANQQT
jgi:hypothetical protein